MKLLNTTKNPIIELFNKKLAIAHVATGCCLNSAPVNLFLKVAKRITPLLTLSGDPSIQIFVPSSFEYGGRSFATDATFTYPNGAIDGVVASFLIDENGKGYQFILFDHSCGTVFDAYFSAYFIDFDLPVLVKRVERYCLLNPRKATP